MEKMRVSTMKITKNGQEKVQPERAPQRDRASLQQRMREAALKREQKDRDAAVLPPPARPKRPVRFFSTSTSQRRQQPEQGKPWRYHFLVQAGISAVVLLSAIGFRALDTPLTNRITDGLTQVVTMDVDVGKELGRLQFVRNVVPDSVLTFWENTEEGPEQLTIPFAGEVTIGFSDEQPGIVYTGAADAVYSAADGTVDSVSKAADGSFVLRIRHNGGYETVYALLKGVKVAPGDAVAAGEEIGLAMQGKAGFHLYFQLLLAGNALDPLTMMPA